MSLAEILVTVGGALLSAGLVWFFFGPRGSTRAEVRDGVQEVDVTVKGGYSPSVIKVREGVPLRLTFDRQESGECTSEVVFPDFRIRRTLPAYARTTVDLLPERSGEFLFACGMNMVHGTLLVEESDGNGRAPGPEQDNAQPSATTVEAVPPPGPDGHTHGAMRRVSIEPDGEVAGRVVLALRGGGAVCATCLRTIEKALEPLPGVRSVQIDVASDVAVVEFDASAVSVQDMRQKVASVGYRVEGRALHSEEASGDTQNEETAERRREIRDLTRRVLVGAVLSAPVLATVMAAEFLGVDVPELLMNRWVQLTLITPVFLYTGWPIHTIGWRTLWHRNA
jgi:Cu+-exporting ATPase